MSNHMRIQIAGVSSAAEALRLADLGVDGLGFTLRLPGGPHDGLTERAAREIVAQLPPLLGTVAITYVTTARAAVELCAYVGVNTLQLHAPVAAGVMAEITRALPPLKIIKSINVTGPSSVADAVCAAREADALILDTYDAATGRHGATGKTHDWQISREIVRCCSKPVLLAGGLTPENVGAAICLVQPWGVDVHTGIENADGTRNWDKIGAFIAAARAAAGA
jgi:phosphoribosylanthranilate isomerase